MKIILCLLIIVIFIVLGIIILKNSKYFITKKSMVVWLILVVILGCFSYNVVVKVNNSKTTKLSVLGNVKQEEQVEQYKNKTVIIVGTTANNMPWSYKQGNNLTGFQTEVITAAVKLMGKKIDIKVLPKKDLLAALNRGDIDVISDFTPTLAKPKKDYLTSQPLSNVPMVFFARKNTNTALERNNNLATLVSVLSVKSVVVEANSNIYNYVNNIFTKNNSIYIAKNANAVILQVVNKKYPVGAVDLFSLMYYMNKHKNSNLVYYKPILGQDNSETLPTNLTFIINKQQDELRQQLNIALNILKNNGKLSEYSMKYFKQDIIL